MASVQEVLIRSVTRADLTRDLKAEARDNRVELLQNPRVGGEVDFVGLEQLIHS